MNKFTKLLFGALLVVGAAATARHARAEGVVLTPAALDPASRASLEAEIARARARNPAMFRAARAVDTFRGAGMMKSRNNQPTAARAFMRLGREALLPMLEMVAWRADTLGLDDAQKIALGDGLLQAVAFARDPRAGPVLEAVFTRAQDARFVGSAAAGLGMLCRARDRALLLSHVRAGEPRRAEAIAGLGHCRSLDVAERLASVLAEPIDDALAVTTARALGYVGSSWAIAASRLDAKQADAIRETAATALARGFSRGNAQLRTAIARAVLMVEHPAALPALRRAERGAPSDVRKDISALRGRLELNIARSSRR